MAWFSMGPTESASFSINDIAGEDAPWPAVILSPKATQSGVKLALLASLAEQEKNRIMMGRRKYFILAIIAHFLARI